MEKESRTNFDLHFYIQTNINLSSLIYFLCWSNHTVQILFLADENVLFECTCGILFCEGVGA